MLLIYLIERFIGIDDHNTIDIFDSDIVLGWSLKLNFENVLIIQPKLV